MRRREAGQSAFLYYIPIGEYVKPRLGGDSRRHSTSRIGGRRCRRRACRIHLKAALMPSKIIANAQILTTVCGSAQWSRLKNELGSDRIKAFKFQASRSLW